MSHPSSLRGGGGGSNKKSSSASSSSSSTIATATPTIPPSLTKQCLQLHHPDQRYANDGTIELSSAFIRYFVIEARRRAAIEAECEAEVNDDGNDYEQVQQQQQQAQQPPASQQSEEDNYFMEEGMMMTTTTTTTTTTTRKNMTIEIRPDHIAKIAAELLLDLS
jgi:hypothetical protein